MSENAKVVVTLKQHGGFDAPWVVFHGDTVQEVQDAVAAAEASGLYVTVGRTAAAFAAVAVNHGAVGSQLGGTPVAAPAAATAAPAAPVVPAQSGPPGGDGPPTCPHGVKTYRTSKPGAAKQWKAWMCPSPQGTPGQCPPQWIN